MLKLKKIAVTGVLASGKSEVARLLEESGAYRIDADKITHQILSSQPILKEKIIQLLGPEIIHNGQLDRRQIAQRVFQDRLLLEKFEKILHPAIRHEIVSQVSDLEKSGQCRCVVVEIPLLFEAGWEDDFDLVIGVEASEEACIQRYMKAGHTKEEYQMRMQRQWSQQDKLKRADIVLHNDGDISSLKTQINQNLNLLF